jgi:hypothetical protein
VEEVAEHHLLTVATTEVVPVTAVAVVAVGQVNLAARHGRHLAIL